MDADCSGDEHTFDEELATSSQPHPSSTDASSSNVLPRAPLVRHVGVTTSSTRRDDRSQTLFDSDIEMTGVQDTSDDEAELLSDLD